jgi:pyruvate/2-oxoglutarate dehydrogenase complex dihydrolipoamide dehydrogenase (E3) component
MTEETPARESWPPEEGQVISYKSGDVWKTAVLRRVRWGLVWRDFVLDDGRVIPEAKVEGRPDPPVWRETRDVTQVEREVWEDRLATRAAAGEDPREREQSFRAELNQYLAYTYLRFTRTSQVSSDTERRLDELPEHLLVLGGGYIGLEFGQMFRRFGSEVTIIQRAGQLLGREDADVADAVLKVMEEDGIKVLLNTEALRVKRNGATIELTVRSAGEQVLRGTHLLVAVGRKPNTEDLNLSAAGVETDKQGNVKVNNRLETNVTGVYALGDVKGGPQFTHISYDDFRIIRTNLLEGGNATTDGRFVPYTVFIDPQLGRVGISETEAKEKGLKFRVAKLPMTHVARAIEMSETRGFMKAIVDADTNQILGAAVLGVEGGELMSMFEIAMMGKLPYTVLKDAIFAHPTLAESLNNLFMAMDR